MSEQSVQDVTLHPATHDVGDDGYHKSLKARHINMIAIGGAIGTGLFLGAGGRLVEAGPSLAIAYAVCGIFAFFVVRALGELILKIVLNFRLDQDPRHVGDHRALPPAVRPQDAARGPAPSTLPAAVLAVDPDRALVFLASVVILMAFDETGRIVVAGLPVIVLALVIGWYGVRRRIDTSVLEKIKT